MAMGQNKEAAYAEKLFTTLCGTCRKPLGAEPFISVQRLQELSGWSQENGHSKSYRLVTSRIHLKHLENDRVPQTVSPPGEWGVHGA